MANMIARLGVVLGLDSAEFVRGIDKASKKLDELSVAATKYAAVAAAALTAASIAALKYADEMVDAAKANDMAVDSIVKLSNALSLSGGSSQDAGKLLASFTNFVDKAASGSFEAQKSFAKLGVGLKDLGQLSSTELFEKTIQALAQIEDPITRNAKAMEILGKAAKGVDITELLTQMQQGKTLADEQAKAIENAAEIYDMITKSGQQFMLMLTTQLGPPLKATIEYFKELKGTGLDIAPAFKILFESIAISVANISFVIKTLIQDFAALGRAAKAIFTGNFEEAKNIYREAVDRAEKDRAALDEFERKILGSGGGASVAGGATGGRPKAGGRQVTPGVDPEAERKRKEAEREAERIRKYILQKEQESLALREQQNKENLEFSDRLKQNGLILYRMQFDERTRLELEKQILDIERNRSRLLPEQIEYEKKRLELQAQREINLRAIDAAQISAEERTRAIQQENENYYERVNVAYQKMSQSLDRRSGSFEQGFMGKMQDFFRDMPTQLEYGAQAFDSVMGNMTRAMDSFVRTGKLSFKDLARSIIQDLIRIQLQAQMTSIFKSIVGLIFPSTGGLTTGDFARMDRASFKADGGPVSGNTPYVVGERGPELFVPRSSGTIVPNHALGGGGVTNVTNNYIQAIDVKSFEDRLLGSSNTIWAANQYAQKSLATGRGRT